MLEYKGSSFENWVVQRWYSEFVKPLFYDLRTDFRDVSEPVVRILVFPLKIIVQILYLFCEFVLRIILILLGKNK